MKTVLVCYILWIYISIKIFYGVCFLVTVSDIQKVLEVCNICYQTQNATLSSKAIEFYTNVAVAYKKSSEFINWKNIYNWTDIRQFSVVIRLFLVVFIEVCMIEVERDLIEGARLAITTQICVSIWSSESKDKQALLVNQYILPNDLMLLFVQNNYAFANKFNFCTL